MVIIAPIPRRYLPVNAIIYSANSKEETLELDWWKKTGSSDKENANCTIKKATSQPIPCLQPQPNNNNNASRRFILIPPNKTPSSHVSHSEGSIAIKFKPNNIF